MNMQAVHHHGRSRCSPGRYHVRVLAEFRDVTNVRRYPRQGGELLGGHVLDVSYPITDWNVPAVLVEERAIVQVREQR